MGIPRRYFEYVCIICDKKVKSCGFVTNNHRKMHLRKGELKDLRIGIFLEDFRNNNETYYSRELFIEKEMSK